MRVAEEKGGLMIMMYKTQTTAMYSGHRSLLCAAIDHCYVQP